MSKPQFMDHFPDMPTFNNIGWLLDLRKTYMLEGKKIALTLSIHDELRILEQSGFFVVSEASMFLGMPVTFGDEFDYEVI